MLNTLLDRFINLLAIAAGWVMDRFAGPDLKQTTNWYVTDQLDPLMFCRATGRARNPGFERKAKKFLEGKTCLSCGTKEDLECHHEFPFHLFPEKEMDEQHWMPLCGDKKNGCHRREGHGLDFHAYCPDAREAAARQLKHIESRKYTK